MIARTHLDHWRGAVPWLSDQQIEQDLVLARLIVEIANHPLLGGELVFRGGTCLHKVWLDRPWRYSEDLDYVRRTEGGVGAVLDAIREVAASVGFDDVRTEIGRHPRRARSTFVNGDSMRIKVEMNTFERSPALPTLTKRFTVGSPWFEGFADVPSSRSRNSSPPRSERSTNDARAVTSSTCGWPFDTPAQHRTRSLRPFTPTARTGGPRPSHSTTSTEKLNDPHFTADLATLTASPPQSYSPEDSAAVAREVIENIGR